MKYALKAVRRPGVDRAVFPSHLERIPHLEAEPVSMERAALLRLHKQKRSNCRGLCGGALHLATARHPDRRATQAQASAEIAQAPGRHPAGHRRCDRGRCQVVAPRSAAIDRGGLGPPLSHGAAGTDQGAETCLRRPHDCRKRRQMRPVVCHHRRMELWREQRTASRSQLCCIRLRHTVTACLIDKGLAPRRATYGRTNGIIWRWSDTRRRTGN